MTIEVSPTSLTPEEAKFHEFITDPLLGQFLGKAAPYYEKKWTKLFSKKKNIRATLAVPSWNFWAFLFGPYWFCYRKMYIHGAIFAALWVLGLVLGDVSRVGNYISLISYLIAGTYGNAIFLNVAYGKLEKIKRQTSPDISAVTEGGTNITASLLCFAAMLVLTCAIYFLSGADLGRMATAQAPRPQQQLSPQQQQFKNALAAAITEAAKAEKDRSIDWSAYQGMRAYDFVTDRQIRDFIRNKIGDRYQAFAANLDVSDAIKLMDGAIYVGKGCMAHACDSNSGYFILNTATGELLAAVTNDGKLDILTGGDMAPPQDVADDFTAWLRQNVTQR